MISEKCHDLATTLFKNWVLIDAAKRYASVEQRADALAATINARASVYDAGSEEILSQSEVIALNTALQGVIDNIESGHLKPAKETLEDLSEQTFMHALQKVVACECGG